jgi:hypothetical protein
MGQFQETHDKRGILHAKLDTKFGHTWVNFSDVVIKHTTFPMEVCCKLHGPYKVVPVDAIKWRGKGAPFCPHCGTAGRPKGSKNKPPGSRVRTPEQIHLACMKSLLSTANWARHFKYEDVSLAEWRKRYQPLLDALNPDYSLSNRELMAAGSELLVKERENITQG